MESLTNRNDHVKIHYWGKKGKMEALDPLDKCMNPTCKNSRAP